MALYLALWINVAVLIMEVSPADDAIPAKCYGSVRTVEPKSSLPQSYYRLYCEVVGKTSTKFDIFHQLSKSPFTKRVCKESGCNYSAWNEMVGGKHVIIDAEWGVSEQYAITVVQLRVCKVPADHNVNRIVTYTMRQLSDSNYCTGLYTRRDDAIHNRKYSNYQYLHTMIEDVYVHLTSDIMTQDEVKKINSGVGSRRTVIHTPIPRCIHSTPDCHISLWMPLNIDCYFYDYTSNKTLRYVEEVIQSTTYGDPSYKFAIARNRKLISYRMVHSIWNRQKREYKLTVKPLFIQVRCDLPVDHPTSFLTDTSRRLELVTLYWPNVTIGSTDGVKRIGNHFYFQPNQQVGNFYIVVVSTLEEEYLNVNQTDQPPQKGEILAQKVFRNSLNYTSMYTLTLSKLTPLIRKTYKIEAGFKAPSYARTLVSSSITIYITKLTEIEMVINPSQIAVVHGDESSKPSFLCVALGYPTPTITWSGIRSLYRAKQIPANASQLPKGYTGTYLQFPSADRMDYAYNGEYTCKVSDPILGTKQATAILLVFEPGSTYDIFNRFVSKRIIRVEEEDVEDITEEERSFIRRLNSSFITEAHRVIRENKEVVATSLLAIVVGVIVIVSLVVWIIIKLCRRRKQLKGYILMRKKKRLATTKND